MAFSERVKKVFSKRVFPETLAVCQGVMQMASVAVSENLQDENIEIARALKRHDPEMIDQLIVQYQHRLLRYLLYLTGDKDVAEDLFQETWMRVLTRGGQFKGKSRFDTWLFTIARHLTIDLRRKRTLCSLDALGDGEDGDRSFEAPSGDPSPLEQYESFENSRRVAEALLTLPPLHREVVVLRFHEELALEDIAQITGAPLSTVKSRLYRGLAALKPRILKAVDTATAVGSAGVSPHSCTAARQTMPSGVSL